MCGERETDRDREREASRYVERKVVTLRERERGVTLCKEKSSHARREREVSRDLEIETL